MENIENNLFKTKKIANQFEEVKIANKDKHLEKKEKDKIYTVEIEKDKFYFAPCQSELKVRYMLPDGCENFAEIMENKNGKGSTLIFNKDCIIMPEDLSADSKKAMHLRFVRADRKQERAKGLKYGRIQQWNRLRKALKSENMQKFHYLGGFTMVPIYQDEIAVADYKVQGSTGWIVNKKEINPLLKKYPLSNSELEKIKADLLEAKNRLDKLENDYSDFNEQVSHYLWIEKHQNCEPRGHWNSYEVIQDNGQNLLYGKNNVIEDENGDLSVYCRGWGRDVKYKSIPENVNAIDMIENIPFDLKHFKQINCSVVHDNQAIWEAVASKEEVMQWIKTKRKPEIESLREQIKKYQNALK